MDEPSGRLAGSDTREALATPTVRLVAVASALVAGPAWASVFASRAAFDRWASIADVSGKLWLVSLIGISLGAALLAWRGGLPANQGHMRFPPGLAALGTMMALAIAVLISGSQELSAWAILLLPPLAGWFFGRAARLAAAACVTQVGPASIGLVLLGVAFGLTLAGPLISVTDGSGLGWGAGWTLVLVGFGCLNLFRARSALSSDQARSLARSKATDAQAGNGHVAAFQCRGVAVTFGASRVLRGVDLQARGGELIALVGANGAGKTTLLRVAAGFVQCRDGRISVGGHDVSMLLPEERAEVGLTFVSGARPIFPDLTVLENLRVAAFRSHIGGRSFASATEAIFELTPALEARRRDRAGVLSGGEQRLLAVAQTLYRRPLVLLADELTLGLASEARTSVLDLLRLLADDGVAVVAVDHDLPSLLPRSDRAVLLSDGIAQSFDNPVSLLDHRSDLLPATFLAQVPR